jgi:autotransporter-associated beta strand protein
VLAGRIVASAPDRALTKSGERGTLVLSNPNNTLPTLNIAGGIVQIGAAGAIPDNTNVYLLTALATFDVNGISETIGGLIGTAGIIQLGTGALTVNCATATSSAYAGEIRGAGQLIKAGPGILRLAGTTANSYAGGTTMLAGQLQLSATSGGAAGFGPLTVSGGTLITELAEQIADSAVVRIDSPGIWRLYTTETIGSLSGSGRFEVLVDSPRKGALIVGGNDTSTTFTGTSGGQTTAPFAVTKVGRGTLTLTGANDVIGNWRVAAGTLILNGPTNSGASLSLDGGVLGGTGPVAHLIGGGGATVGTLSPGSSPARFTVTDALIGGPVVIDLDGPTAGSGYDQLQATGPVRLTTTASLQIRRTFPAPAGSRFTIIDNAMAMIGTFAGLPEGGTLSADGQRFGISYSGGDGHDVVLTALEDPPRLTYYLAEGATGAFFDEDVLIANPNRDEAPVTITFLKDTGEQVEISRTLPAESHLMIHVDEIPGLEGAAASAQIVSRSGQPLFVERSMFWDATYYAGHTGSAISEPAPDWFFAEGAQGYFSTFVLIVNPNDNAADVTFTFLREGESPVVKTVAVGPRARLTVGAGDFAELRARSFGIRVHATQPIMAERAMYFGSLPGRLWGGGHESAGVAEPSMQWYLAEGATGGYFDTFILLSNPQGSPASVTVTYLLPTGETVIAQKTIAANGRLTVNPEAEGDARLRNATVSTVVTADVPIVAERSMYWPGATRPWGEAHNSFGVTAPRTEWGLAEGRLGGRVPFSTYILLANPGATPAEVEVRFLRDTGASIVVTYTVPATGRYTIDVSSIAALRGSSFGAAIQVTNNVPIFVERSMYWDANGVFWSGGTNGTAIPWSVPR